MKYTYLRLKNFIGIYAGTGRNEIEINFKRNFNGSKITRNKIIMLIGPNGSGKSTILNSLTPIHSNLDDRDTLILDGLDGEKEIHINHNENNYKILHYYQKGGGVKSYISKNGEELNKAGLVRNFEDIIKKELNFDKDYIKVGRIGCDVKNFINLKPAERKKYISGFLPNLEEYYYCYKVVHKKVVDMENKIRYIAENINKIPEENKIVEMLNILTSRINEHEEKIEKVKNEINKNKGRIDNTSSDINSENVDIRETYSSLKSELSTIKNRINSFYGKHPKLTDKKKKELNDILKKVKSKIKKANNEITQLSSSKTTLKDEIIRNRNFIKEKNELMEGMLDGEAKSSLVKSLAKKEALLEEQKKFITENKETKFSEKDYESIISMKNMFELTCKEVKEFINEHSNDDVVFFTKNKVDEETIASAISNQRDSIANYSKEIKRHKASLSILEDNKSQLKILEKRPAKCKIDDCPFIRNALKYKDRNLDDELADKEKLIKSLETEIVKSEKKIEGQNDLLKVISEYKRIYKRLRSSLSDELLDKLPNTNFFKKFSSFKAILDLPLSELEEVFNLDMLLTSLKTMNEIELTEQAISNIKNTLSYVEKNESLIDEVKKEFSSAENKIKENKKEIETLDEKESQYVEYLKVMNGKEEILTNLISLVKEKIKTNKKFKEVKKVYDKLKLKFERIEFYREENKLLEKELSELKEKMTPIKSKHFETTTSLNELIKYKEMKSELEGKYEKAKYIDEALNPVKGIPLHFVENYLLTTRKIANDLLSIAYNEKFLIGKLNISESDFTIPIISSDSSLNNKSDVLMASAGEIALTKISLSLALIEQSVKDFNIILLDESDATLDSNNRQNFLEILNKQIERMNIEQVFIITHNNCFDSSNLDLILLKDNDVDEHDKFFMNGKNILFKV